MGSSRGDTLIEVMMAISIMAIVVVGTFSVMNKGLANMYDSLEVSEVQQLINRQAESLRYARDQYLARKNGHTLSASDNEAADVWVNSLGNASGVGNWSGETAVPRMDNCDVTTNAFFIQRSAGGASIAVGTNNSFGFKAVAAGFPSPGNGIWIQRTSTAAGVPYKDFFIRACWESVGGGDEKQVLSTIVRLYDQ